MSGSKTKRPIAVGSSCPWKYATSSAKRYHVGIVSMTNMTNSHGLIGHAQRRRRLVQRAVGGPEPGMGDQRGGEQMGVDPTEAARQQVTLTDEVDDVGMGHHRHACDLVQISEQG